MISKKKILIIGKNSFIASHLLKNISISNDIYFYKFSKKINIKKLEIDKKKLKKIIIYKHIDFIINFHAHTDIKYSFLNPNYDFYHNSLIHRCIVDALCNLNYAPFYLCFGTCTQVGTTKLNSKISLNTKSNPETIFDLHKQYNEDYLKVMKLKYKINGTSLRLSNIFGTGKVHSKKRGVISTLINNAYKKESITLYGDGKFIRDLLYIDDLVLGILLALKYSHKLNKNFYYLTSGQGFSFLQLSKIIRKILKDNYNKKVNIKFLPWPKETMNIDKRSFVGNPNEFIKLTGWKPKYTLKKAIIHYLEKNFK